MNLMVFLAIVALVSATIDKRQYYRSSSLKDDERDETMQFIAEKRERVNKIDWDNLNPSAAKNRGPAREARISAFLNRMDANNIPPSDKIGPYESRSENDIKTPNKKTFDYSYVPSYQSPVETTASGSKTKMTPDVMPSISKYKMRHSEHGDSYKTSPKHPSQSLEIAYKTPHGSFNHDESSGESPTPKCQAKRSDYGSYKSNSDDESEVVRSPTPTSKINIRTQESSDKYTTLNYRTKSYDSYAADSKYVSPVVEASTEEFKMHATSPPAFSRSSKPSYQMKSSASFYVNNAEQLTPSSENVEKKSDETPVESTNKWQTARSLWSGSPTKGHGGLIPNVKLPSPMVKIPKPLVPKRNSNATTTVPLFAVANAPTSSLKMNNPATREIPQEPPVHLNQREDSQPLIPEPSYYTFPKIPNKYVSY